MTVCLDLNSQWRFPLLTCRALSTGPAIWWGFRCGLTFLGELLRGEGAGLWGGEWEVEKRFRVTEVFLAILWVGPEQLSTAWPSEKRLTTTGPSSVRRQRICRSSSRTVSCHGGQLVKIRVCESGSPNSSEQAPKLYPLSGFRSSVDDERIDGLRHILGAVSFRRVGGSTNVVAGLGFHCHGEFDETLWLRMLLSPAVADHVVRRKTLTVVYHLTQRKINIKKETSASIHVFSVASFVSLCSLLLQLHLTRENDPVVPFFLMAQRVWEFVQRWAVKGSR